MEKKLQKVISSCATLAQLRSALNYVTNYGISNGCDGVFYDAISSIKKRVTEMTGFHYQNYVDYKAYAEHLIVFGLLTDANDFIELAEIEIDKLENFAKQ